MFPHSILCRDYTPKRCRKQRICAGGGNFGVSGHGLLFGKGKARAGPVSRFPARHGRFIDVTRENFTN